MKSALKFLSLLFAVLILTNTAYAESPREQLKQMVEQLQANPDDDALREKIIKFAQKLKPAPAIPEEAERRMGRGTAAFKGSKSVADYQKAAQEFEQATLAAPWYGDAYFNLGVAQDKAEEYEDALSNLKLALLSLPNSKDIKALIYEVEYRKEVNAPEAKAAQERERQEAFLRSLDGGVWAYENNANTNPKSAIEIKGNQLFDIWEFGGSRPRSQLKATLTGNTFVVSDGKWCDANNAKAGGYEHCASTGSISEDGKTITLPVAECVSKENDIKVDYCRNIEKRFLRIR